MKGSEDGFRLTADVEDHTIGLTGTLRVGGFAGFGTAWFNTLEVEAFASALDALAVEMAGAATLIGGNHEGGRIVLEMLGLRVRVLQDSFGGGICRKYGRYGQQSESWSFFSRGYLGCRGCRGCRWPGLLETTGRPTGLIHPQPRALP